MSAVIITITQTLPSTLQVRQEASEAACQALRDQLAAAKQRAVQLEGGLRARDREIDKAYRAGEGSQAAQHAAELRAAEVALCLAKCVNLQVVCMSQMIV